MQLHLPTLLRRALLACVACASFAPAATFLAEGVNTNDLEASQRFYDGGKGSYLSDAWSTIVNNASALFYENNVQDNSFKFLGELYDRIPTEYQTNFNRYYSFQNLTNDGGHCWAYTSGNVIQYWQSYYGVFAKNSEKIAYGHTYDKEYLVKLGGTQSLDINMVFYDAWQNIGGEVQYALSWYLGGVNGYSGLKAPSAAAPGAFAEFFPNALTTSGCNTTTNIHSGVALSDFSHSIKTQFGYEKQENGSYVQTTKGQILYLELGGVGIAGSHAITCYGFDTDADGNVTALHVTNSDDQAYELFTLDVVKTEKGYQLYQNGMTWAYAGKNWQIFGFSSIATPQVLKDMLAEYERGNLVWMGNLDSWTNTFTPATTEALPTDETGWMVYSGSNTDHAGYYNSYYAAGRGVEFNDSATSGSVTVGEDMSVPSMLVNNNTLAYNFTGEGVTITTDSFTKQGAGAVSFDGVKLVAGTVTLGGDATFDELHVTGTLHADGKNLNANSVQLDGNATIGSIGVGATEEGIGNTTALTITGGTTAVQNGTTWTGLTSLAMSDQARLTIGASLYVGGDITTCEATGTLPEGTQAGIEAKYCIKVGGDVTLTGDLIGKEAYVSIGGKADITGNASASSWLSIKGKANISGNLGAGGDMTLGSGGYVGGQVKAGTLTIGGDASIGSISGNTTALTLTGGTTTVRDEGSWTNLKSLAMSGQSRLTVGASVFIAENITTHTTATGTLPEGTQAGIQAKYCIETGTEGNAGTGHVTMVGDLTAGAYIKLRGNVDVTGNISTSGTDNDHTISIGGDAKVGGSISGNKGITIGGKAEVTGGLRSAGGDIALAKGGSVGGLVELAAGHKLTAGEALHLNGGVTGAETGARAIVESTGALTLGGSASHVDITAQSLSISAMDESRITLDSVNISVEQAELDIRDVIVRGNSSFSTSLADTQLTLNVTDVTFVLDGSNSAQGQQQATPQLFGLVGGAETLTETEVGSDTFAITSSMLDGVVINGDLTIDISHWADEIKAGGYNSIQLTFAEDVIAAGTPVRATLNGTDFATADVTSGNMAQFGVADLPMGAVPEPTSATLSLLALAALAARRRRRAGK